MNPFISSKLKITLLFLFSITAFSQAQLIKQWDYRFGGSAIDEFHDVISTDDGGYLLAGYSESGIGGDKTTASQGSGDFWIIKISSTGIKQWEKDFGGSSYDELFEAQQTNDGGYILGGWSNSGISGNKTQASFGAGDYWVVKTDASGNIQWDRTFGGSSEDYLQSIKQTSDSGFILAGRSNSGISGSKTQANRGTIGVTWDYWVVKINKLGTKQWDQTYGGIDDDQLVSAQQTSDGGYFFGGYSNSGISGEKSQASQGLDDYWMVKTDANGVKQWDKSFGGTSADQAQMMLQTSDGGYILGGASASGANGDKSQGSRGNFDYWIVKTNASGVKQWDKRFGGSSADNLFDLIQTSDGGYLLGGASSSAAGGDKSQGNQGTVGSSFDYWMVKVDASGTAQLDKRFGGSLDDYSKSITETADGNYVVAGWSTSGATGDKTQGTQGSIDYWVLKVSGPNSITTSTVTGPLCAGTNINVSFSVTGTFAAGNIFTAQISDSLGSFAAPSNIGTLTATSGGTINCSLPSGISGTGFKIQVISNNPIAQDIYPSGAFQVDIPQSYWVDADNDGYGSTGSNPSLSCTPIVGYVTNDFDCNDNDPLAYSIPGGADGIVAQGTNCEGSSGNIFATIPIFQAASYQWVLSSGLSSSIPNNLTSDTLISIAIANGATFDSIGVSAKNSCGLSDTLYLSFSVSPLPAAAGPISGSTNISSCTNQNNIEYSIAPIANATNYVWVLPDSSSIVGNSDTTSIVVNYSAYGVSGPLSVYGTNSCGSGTSSNLAITYDPIPQVELCYITVDSATQKSILWWQKPNASQSDSIVIMRKVKGSSQFTLAATVKDTVPTSFLDLNSDPTTVEGESYKLAVKDTCGNIGSFSAVTTHRTIYLYGLLGWNAIPKLYWYDYLGIQDPQRYYRILKDVTGAGPFSIVKDSIAYSNGVNNFYTDNLGANCSTCRYAVEMVSSSNCTPTQRMLLNKSTSRSNIKNKNAMPFDSTLTNIQSPLQFEMMYSVYPNPSHENISLNMLHSTTKINFQLFNMVGEEVWQEKAMEGKSGDILVIPTAQLPRGIYTLKIAGENSTAIKKIVLN